MRWRGTTGYNIIVMHISAVIGGKVIYYWYDIKVAYVRVELFNLKNQNNTLNLNQPIYYLYKSITIIHLWRLM